MSNSTKYILIGAVVLLLFYEVERQKKLHQQTAGITDKTGDTQLLTNHVITSDGLAINNPANIRTNPNVTFDYEINSPSSAFKSFSSLEANVRALRVILDHYVNSLGLTTLWQIIGRYAPASENDTANYVHYVSDHTGYNPNEDLEAVINSGGEGLHAIIHSMLMIEQGSQWMTTNMNDTIINNGINLA